MSSLDDLPKVDTFFGVDLKTGSYIIAALGIVHPVAYGCTFCIPVSYLFISVWSLVVVYFAASIMLFVAIGNNDETLCSIWVWYSLVFTALMMISMILVTVVYALRCNVQRIFIAIVAFAYYLLSLYFVLVVNSHRLTLTKK